MVVGVGAAGEWELWGWDPLGAAVFVFSGPPAAGGDEAVVVGPQAKVSRSMLVRPPSVHSSTWWASKEAR